MTDPVTTIASIRRSIEQLDARGDADSTLTARTLRRLLNGEPFEAAAGLLPGWHRYVQRKECDTALQALLRMHPGVDDAALARHIIAGVKRVNLERSRPSGEASHLYALARAGFDLAERTCRERLADLRGGYNAVIRHAEESPLPKPEMQIP